jgi:single-strand DNA-binding protein
MSKGYNRITIVGNLGFDPEPKQAGDKMMVRMRVAVNDWGDRTNWFTVKAFGKQAEICDRYVKKGDRILVEGRIDFNEYTNKEGQKVTATDLVASNIVLLGGGNKEPGAHRQQEQKYGGQYYSGGSGEYGGGGNGNGNGNVPF